MRPVILYRGREFEENEKGPATDAGFTCINSRMHIQKGDLVVGRYSVLPFYEEQEHDIKLAGANLINSYQQHRYIADMKNWYEDLQNYTPQTWFRLEDIPEEGPFILKGETNSQKFLWDELMYAANKKEAVDIYCRLKNDSLLQYQDIVIRKYTPLKKFLTGLRGLPITNEWRFFTAYGYVLTYGYYWSSYIEDVKEKLGREPSLDKKGVMLVTKLLEITKHKTNALVMDIAQLENGDWILIELNDLQMSGLSENNPCELYNELMYTIKGQEE